MEELRAIMVFDGKRYIGAIVRGQNVLGMRIHRDEEQVTAYLQQKVKIKIEKVGMEEWHKLSNKNS